MALKRTQVAIVGGGMVGLALAIDLAQQGRQVTVIEKQSPKLEPPAPWQLRVSALSVGTQQWFNALGVWQQLPVQRLGPYRDMQVWDKDSAAHIEFAAEQAGLEALGHIVENAVIESQLWQRAQHCGVDLIAEVDFQPPEFNEQDVTLSLSNGDIVLAQLLVAADGANSRLRQLAATPLTYKDYEQQGLVATVRSTQPHGQVARQVFMPGGPLALLPLADPHLLSIVWSLPVLEAQAIASEADEPFNQCLTAASDNVLGLLTVESERRNFPLQMRYAERWLHQRQVLIGDAAHTIHPLAGQGANLGLADARALAAVLNDLGTLNGYWDPVALMRALRGFERARKAAAIQHIAVMEGFHQLFKTAHPLVKAIRGLGLNAVNQVPLFKQFFLQQASQ